MELALEQAQKAFNYDACEISGECELRLALSLVLLGMPVSMDGRRAPCYG